MTTNKELVISIWNAFARGDIRTAFAGMSDTVTWHAPGGVRTGKTEILESAREVARLFPGGLTNQLRHVYSDGDTVIIEMSNVGTAFNGKHYTNEYCFIFEIDDGKIRCMREYADTLKAKELLA